MAERDEGLARSSSTSADGPGASGQGFLWSGRHSRVPGTVPL